MLLRLYNDDSPLIGLPKDKTEQAEKMKDGSSEKAEDDQIQNGAGADHDGKGENTISEQADS